MSTGMKDSKTEHSGAKKGRGAYYSGKREAKEFSNASRRRRDRVESDAGLDEFEEAWFAGDFDPNHEEA